VGRLPFTDHVPLSKLIHPILHVKQRIARSRAIAKQLCSRCARKSTDFCGSHNLAYRSLEMSMAWRIRFALEALSQEVSF
jgi:hypothetical protein